jgi:hypothetical protein
MSIKSKLAIAALFTVIAAPAFAGDQDSAALAVSSGRYLPGVNVWTQPSTVYSGAYASAVRPGSFRLAPAGNSIATGAYDFQLDGR